MGHASIGNKVGHLRIKHLRQRGGSRCTDLEARGGLGVGGRERSPGNREDLGRVVREVVLCGSPLRGGEQVEGSELRTHLI